MKSISDRFENIKKIGLKRNIFLDLYHQLLTMTWTKFFLVYSLSFILFNLIFGLLYWLDVSGVSGTENDFFKNFAFSVQTFSTVGYGVFAPVDAYTHSIVIVESLLGVLFTALLAGLAFAKFSRAKARIQFTDKVVITNYNSNKTLMFRIANLRGNQIAQASVNAVILVSEKSIEGNTMRMQKNINFIRDTSSFFILTWTVMHIIDEKSPLYGLTAADIVNKNIEMSVSVIGHDETFSQTVHMSGIYSSDDFIFDRDFDDMFTSDEGKVFAIDYSKFNKFKEI